MTRAWVRAYLLKHTPKTLQPVEDGEPGQLSKIREEYLELVDALKQQNDNLALIEACDIMDAAMKFNYAQFGLWGITMIVLVYLRRIYKPFRNRLYSYAGLSKGDFNGRED